MKTKTLADFDAELAAAGLHGQWNADAALTKLTDGPAPAGAAALWPWELVHGKLREACDLFPESLTARRNVTFVNPALPRRGTTHTIVAGMQLVRAGEVAWSHRHTIAALRFTIDGGERLCTVVDGQRCIMESNDLILTPSWAWHDHHNDGQSDAVWLDVLDMPLVRDLNQTFYEPFGESVQPVDAAAARPYRYAWREVRELLRAQTAFPASPFHGVRVAYAGRDGGWTLPSLACYVQLLRPGERTMPHRRTSSAVCYVIEGHGTAVIGSQELAWKARDTFAVPNWSRHQLINRSDDAEAIIFSVTDEPLLAALGLLRSDPQDDHPVARIGGR